MILILANYESVLVSDMISITILPDDGAYRWIRVVSYILVYCTVFIKPIVYIRSNEFFKEAFYDTFPFLKPKAQSNKEDIQIDNLHGDSSTNSY